MTGGPLSGRLRDAKTLGAAAAEELWKKAREEEAEPRPLQIQYSIESAGEEPLDQEDETDNVTETVFEDPNEAKLRPRLLVPLQSVLGLKALCEREYTRTETVTELLNQCRTAYYKELLYLREQLILAAEPEKQLMLDAVQNYEVYFFNPPAYVDDDLREYILNCSRWTHKKLIEENYELQMKLSGAGQNDVFDNADFCLKGLLRRHGTYRLFKIMHRIVSNAKDLFDPEDMLKKQEEGLKPLDELQAAITEVFPNLRAREDNSGALLAQIHDLQKALTDAKTEIAKLKGLLESEKNRSDELSRKCDDQERLLHDTSKAPSMVDGGQLQELEELKQRMQEEVDAQAERMKTMIKDLASGKSFQLGRSKPAQEKVFPKLDEAIADLDKLFAKLANEVPQTVTRVQASDDGGSEQLANAQKEIQQLKQEIASWKAKLAAAEQREQEALAKLKELKKGISAPQPKVPESPSNAGVMSDNVDELKKQLERKIAKVAELEADLDQARRDLRAAQRTIDEKDLLLQERARKDADHAKKLSELMEKLRKSEEEAEKLAGKLYKAEEKIKNLREQIRELKNQLGMPQEQSEEEVEEEVDTTTVFMSRYYLRAKNSGKPRWMLLSEDAKYKSQKKNQEDRNQSGPGWTSAHHQPQDASQAFNFLRKAPGTAPGRGTKVRLQYSYTQTSPLNDPDHYDPNRDASPFAQSPHSSAAFSRMSTFHNGVMQSADNSPVTPHAAGPGGPGGPGGQRFMHSNSMPFAPGGFADYSPQRGPVHGGFSRQGTSTSFVSRASTPPQSNPIYVAGGGVFSQNASWRSGQAPPSTGPAYTSAMAGPLGSNWRQDLGIVSQSSFRLGTPPAPIHPSIQQALSQSQSGLGALSMTALNVSASSHASASPTDSTVVPESTGGLSQQIERPSPLASGPADDEDEGTSTGLPITLPSSIAENTAHPSFAHSSSSLSLSPTSSRVATVGLAMIDPESPEERPMLQLVPQTEDMRLMQESCEVSPSRRGQRVLEPLRHSASWSSFPSSWSQAEGPSGRDNAPAGPNMAKPSAVTPSVVTLGAEAEGLREPDLSQPVAPVHRAIQHAPTMPLEVEVSKTSSVSQSRGLACKGGAPKEVGQGDAVDLLIQHAKSQPLSQPLSGQVRAEAPSSLSWARSNGSKSSLPLTNCFKGKARPVLGARSTTNLESPGQYIHSESLPRLPGGKVKKASQPASWLSPL